MGGPAGFSRCCQRLRTRGPKDGEALAIFDLAWPEGVQLELTEPIALLLNEPPSVERIAAANGFRFFTSTVALKEYVEREVLEGEVRGPGAGGPLRDPEFRTEWERTALRAV